jgi:hypothetical protein
VTQTLLGDNARSLVVAHDRAAQTVRFHPAYVAFCRDWGVVPRTCAPYRARTKGKTESGVKYVKRNGLAGRDFDSFAGLETHLVEWMQYADNRIHGTTHETPRARFDRDEARALRPLPERAVPIRERHLERRVANDSLVDIDMIRYSVPHRLVRERVMVHVGEKDVRVFRGAELVATHARAFEPHTIVRDPAHFAGLWRPADTPSARDDVPKLAALGRSLDEYADAIGQAGAA